MRTMLPRVVVQADNKIVVAGYAWNGSTYDFALARIHCGWQFWMSIFSDDGKVSTDFAAKV